MFQIEEDDDKKIEKRFELGTSLVKQGMFAKIETSNEVKLTLYACFKQATIGPCKEFGGDRPGFFSFEAKLKYDAWLALEDMSKLFAKRDYCITLDNMLPGWDKLHERKIQKDLDEFLLLEAKEGLLEDSEDWIQGFEILESDIIQFEVDLSFIGSFIPIKVEIPQETYPKGKYSYKSMKNVSGTVDADNLKDALTKILKEIIKIREKALEELME
eukprot:gene12534-6356_t